MNNLPYKIVCRAFDFTFWDHFSHVERDYFVTAEFLHEKFKYY
jgi:hypothetical protein